MAKAKLKKSEGKTLRLFKQTDFAIEFWARRLRQSDNAFIEAACEHYADVLSEQHAVDWRELFDVDDSIRQLRLYMQKDGSYPFTDEEEAERDFVREHVAFFYNRRADGSPSVNKPAARVLFPRVSEFMALQKKNYASAAKAMREALKEQGLPPEASKP